MTIGVVYRAQDNVVWMAADSSVYDPNDGTIEQAATTKVFYVNKHQDIPFLVTASGDVRFADILQYVWEPPALPSLITDREISAWLVKSLVPSLIQTVEDAGYLQIKDGKKHIEDNDVLIAFANQIVYIDDAFGVVHVPYAINYYAIGSGRRYALGALAALHNVVELPVNKCILAVKAAEQYSPTCAGPINYAASNDERHKVHTIDGYGYGYGY